MSPFEALILGIIQGLTEFLPVSSSGHLELGNYFLGTESENNLLFAIAVHGATALSTIVVFRKSILELLAGLFKFSWNEETQFIVKIAISMIPVGIVGVFFEDQIEGFFAGNIILVSSMLAVTGILLLFTHYSKTREGSVSFKTSLIIGISQALAILPGISRSGATISTALLLGIDKSKAARFSFLMVLPPILGASLLKFIEFIKTPIAESNSLETVPLTIGFIAAFISGLVACQWMINIVKRGKLIYFAIYCLIVSSLVFLSTL